MTITSEYVGVLKSRRSSEIRPQVDGIITQIFVKSGDRVAPGRALLQIDPRREQAALESNQASRVARRRPCGSQNSNSRAPSNCSTPAR